MAKSNFLLTLLQLNSNNDRSRNLQQILKLLEQRKSSGLNEPQLVVLPENALFMKIDPIENTQALELSCDEFKKIQAAIADKDQLLLTTALTTGEAVYNSTVLINKQEIKEVYRKIHLFDVNVSGEKSLRESEQYSHGSEASVIEVFGCRIGLSICYDLRFAELYSYYAKQEVDLILVPAAFLETTGEAHWRVLLRARAIESQCFVAAPAQTGLHQSSHSEAKRVSFGHSMIVDPWGQVVVESQQTQPEVLSCTFDFTELSKVRGQIPMKSHRRL